MASTLKQEEINELLSMQLEVIHSYLSATTPLYNDYLEQFADVLLSDSTLSTSAKEMIKAHVKALQEKHKVVRNKHSQKG